MKEEFWRGRSVLVTGHTGFKGSWLALWLKALGARVCGVGLPPATDPNLFEVLRLAETMHSVVGDIRDLDFLRSVLADVKPEIVFHMAAQSLVRVGYDDPVGTFETNVLGTVNLLEASRHVDSVRSVVIVTTDKCYENREWIWGYRESDQLGGRDPYSNSKACAELVTQCYRTTFFGSAARGGHAALVATARAGNVIGGGDWSKDRLVPDVLKRLSLNQPVELRAPGSIRPWQHVLEPLCGYLQLAQALTKGDHALADAYNFGPRPDDVRSVEWVTGEILRRWGADVNWRLSAQAGPPEARLLMLDSAKANRYLNWRPRWSLEEALDRIVSWHKAFLEGQDMVHATMSDIQDYMNTEPKVGF